MSAPTITWEQAESMFPGCSAQWDAQGELDPSIPVVVFVNSLETLTCACANDVERTPGSHRTVSVVKQLATYWYYAPETKRWVIT